MKKKYIKAGIIAVLLIAVSFNLWKNRGGCVVTIDQNLNSSKVSFFYQKDGRWKDEELGESRYTIGSSGCIITCLASICSVNDMNNDSILNVNPSTLNQYLREQAVYDHDGNIQWDELQKALGVTVIRENTSEVNSDILSEYIRSGKYPIVRVHMPITGKNHYVLLIGSQNGSFLCMDPLSRTNEPVSLKKYGNKIYAVRTIMVSVDNYSK